MRRQRRRLIEAFCPTRQFINELKVGDFAPDCFGKWREVLEIHAKREDIAGRMFVCYYTEFGRFHGRLSNSLKENQLHRSLPLTGRLNSWQCDQLERNMRNHQEDVRLVA